MEDLCIFCILYLLKSMERQQVEREILIQKLYRIPLADIDFTLPQLWYATSSLFAVFYR